uniref:cytochrome b n=1 Tax=Virpazaria ripkeni TaxID=2939667 RepID=UPI002029928B|nr:cytochrome b [Virpazaria ripkeni]UPV69725.1 cytochrome b [Virpazaria ripkeni]UPV69738.1 cytochrome b [Virpazaria ripkeni]
MHKIKPLNEISILPTPMNINVWWSSGSILGMLLGVQLLTGFFLSMHYTSDILVSFDSVIHIMRDVQNGWITRLLHANGASFFFIFLYLHLGRGLYYQSYFLQPKTWMVGVTIFLLSMATAFLGYVLPWGQMSFWGATVITNLLSAIPYWGNGLVLWMWGGFSIGQATLNRFYSLHFILPFVIMLLVMLHLIFLHDKGSTNPLGHNFHINKITFHPYFTYKDLVGFIMVMLSLILMCCFYPYSLSDPENFIFANPMITPTHIQPEWYFLFAYAILRSIPSKLGGVIALAMSIIILYFLPFAHNHKLIPSSYNFFYQVMFWILVTTFILLTWLGACPIEDPYPLLAKPLTFIYFMIYPASCFASMYYFI